MTNSATSETKHMNFFIQKKDKNRVFTILNPSSLKKRLAQIKLNPHSGEFRSRSISSMAINFENPPKLRSHNFKNFNPLPPIISSGDGRSGSKLRPLRGFQRRPLRGFQRLVGSFPATGRAGGFSQQRSRVLPKGDDFASLVFCNEYNRSRWEDWQP